MNTITSLLAAGAQADGNSLNQFEQNIKKLFSDFVGYAIGILAAAVLGWSLYCGIKYIGAKNADQNKEAKRIIQQFIVGIIIVFVLAGLAVALIGFLANWQIETGY